MSLSEDSGAYSMPKKIRLFSISHNVLQLLSSRKMQYTILFVLFISDFFSSGSEWFSIFCTTCMARGIFHQSQRLLKKNTWRLKIRNAVSVWNLVVESGNGGTYVEICMEASCSFSLCEVCSHEFRL